ncbi:O-methyltransferase [Xylariales sp. PMI_506]|nr:O-methyltransferase [Xylariales sp. PMI_506]
MSAPSEATIPATNALEGVPQHIRDLLARLHAESSAQETGMAKEDFAGRDFHEVMRDKFIALDEDKSHYVYSLLRALGATTIVEAGTSYGVSTIYLALAAAANADAAAAAAASKAAGSSGIVARKARVIGTEHEAAKAAKAREYWAECGEPVTSVIELREGDLRETLKEDLEDVDFLLLDIWTPMALPTLKLVQPKMRRGAVVIADNTISSQESYAELLNYLRDPTSGFINITLPYKGGLEMSVYLPPN